MEMESPDDDGLCIILRVGALAVDCCCHQEIRALRHRCSNLSNELGNITDVVIRTERDPDHEPYTCIYTKSNNIVKQRKKIIRIN